MTEPDLISRFYDSPVGRLTLVADEIGLAGLWFEAHRPAPAVMTDRVGPSAVLDAAVADLDAYFADARHRPTTPLAARGTALERAVWAELATIPCGATRTYGAIAAALGRPKAARAVGAAVGRNPLSIFVPCHRVVGASGALTGFAGGLPRKAWLLAHERAR